MHEYQTMKQLEDCEHWLQELDALDRESSPPQTGLEQASGWREVTPRGSFEWVFFLTGVVSATTILASPLIVSNQGFLRGMTWATLSVLLVTSLVGWWGERYFRSQLGHETRTASKVGGRRDRQSRLGFGKRRERSGTMPTSSRDRAWDELQSLLQ